LAEQVVFRGGVHGCIPFRNALSKRSGGERSRERYGSPEHRMYQRWSSTSSFWMRTIIPPTEQVAKNMSTP
jgi:hypothetical protein